MQNYIGKYVIADIVYGRGSKLISLDGNIRGTNWFIGASCNLICDKVQVDKGLWMDTWSGKNNKFSIIHLNRVRRVDYYEHSIIISTDYAEYKLIETKYYKKSGECNESKSA